MKDFTLDIYCDLLDKFISGGYTFYTYEKFHELKPEKALVLRHDIDARKENALTFARIQAQRSVRGTYYFRTIPQSYNESLIREVHALGHEIGYHYETMDTCRGDVARAYDEFCRNLEKFRKLVPVKTICMHGSPLSHFDNRAIWHKYDYRELGLTAEPYFDLDFSKTFYLTDTGRRWDGDKVSIRDKAYGTTETYHENGQLTRFHHTSEIIEAIAKKLFPPRAMITFHPQRWTNDLTQWYYELIAQNLKNSIKAVLVKRARNQKR